MSMDKILDDWPMVKERWAAWWEGEMVDRPLLQVFAPKDGATPGEPQDVDLVAQWTDIDFMIRRTLEQVRTTYYGGESLPVFWHNWSAGHVLYFGCEPHFTENTVWVDPAPVGDDGYPSFDGWRESPWWKWMFESTEAVARRDQGQYFIMPMWGNHAGDNLSLVRGIQQLLMDIATDRKWVKWAVKAVSDIQIEVFAELWPLVSQQMTGLEGSVNYCSCWSPKRTIAFDCDLSAMISSEAYKELFLPPLVETMHTVDHRIYHVDGPGALHHLATLLDLPELQAIQWIPGAGHMEVMQWLPVIKRIQERGKSVQVFASPQEVEPLLKEIKPEGLVISTHCETEAQARQLVARVGSLY